MFSTLSKMKVRDSINARGGKASTVNINVKLYSLVKKGFLKRDEDGVIILVPSILALIEKFRANNKLEFTLSFNRDKETNITHN